MTLPFSTRDFDGSLPGLMHPEKRDPNDSKTAAQRFVDMLNSREGLAVIGIGVDDVVIAVGLDWDGKNATATLNTIDATATTLLTAEWDGAGNLTITANANATAAATVSWRVSGA